MKKRAARRRVRGGGGVAKHGFYNGIFGPRAW